MRGNVSVGTVLRGSRPHVLTEQCNDVQHSEVSE